MKRVVVILLMLAAVVGIGLVMGCSDDEKKPTGSTPGDPTDERFLMAKGIIGPGYLDQDNRLIDLSLELGSLIMLSDKSGSNHPFRPRGEKSVADSLSWEYSYSNFWHIFQVTAYLVYEFTDSMPKADTLIFAGIDSLRFGNDLGPQRYPDTSTTTLNIRAHVDADVMTEDTDVNGVKHVSYDLLADDWEMYVNGTTADSLQLSTIGEGWNCDITLRARQTVTGLYYDSAALVDDLNDCPQAGTIRVNGFIDMGCAGDSGTFDMTGNWLIVFQFDDGMVTATYDNGTNIWTVTEPCGDNARLRRYGDMDR
jgi:hypothetical protein